LKKGRDKLRKKGGGKKKKSGEEPAQSGWDSRSTKSSFSWKQGMEIPGVSDLNVKGTVVL